MSAKLISFVLMFVLLGGIMNNLSFSDNHPDVSKVFENSKSLKNWSDSYFKGGYKISNFKKDNIKLFVVIGSFTFGVETSYLRIYLETEKGIELLVTRESVPGELVVTENEEGLVFRNNDKTILVFPWEGAYLWSLNSSK